MEISADLARALINDLDPDAAVELLRPILARIHGSSWQELSVARLLIRGESSSGLGGGD